MSQPGDRIREVFPHRSPMAYKEGAPPAKVCPTCTRTFQPASRSQIYCIPECKPVRTKS